MENRGLKLLGLSVTLATTLLTGCAKNPTSSDDPYEGYNRVMFAFNQDIDHLAIRPVAKTYDTLTPPVLKKGVINAFANVGEVETFSNDVLQGNWRYLPGDFWRFVINSTFGVGGLFDVATRMGIPKHTETFGLTFAKWRGGQSAPYFVIPFLGPSTIQNTFALGPKVLTQPWFWIDNNAISYSALGLRLTSIRARLLPADKLIETSFDPYVFVRDAYMQTDKTAIAKNEALPKSPKLKQETLLPAQGDEATKQEAQGKTPETTTPIVYHSASDE